MSNLTSSIAHRLSAQFDGLYAQNVTVKGRLFWSASTGLEVCVNGEFEQYPTVDSEGARQIAFFVNYPLTVV